MSKWLYFILGLFLLFSCLFMACEEDVRSKDKTPPQITDISINKNDTIVAGHNIIYINTHQGGEIDTIVLGHYLNITARFEDNSELSSYKISIDSLPRIITVERDTALFISRGFQIFGIRDTLVHNQLTVLIPRTLFGQNGPVKEDIPVREGIYTFGLYCVDKSGNEDSVKVQVSLLARETIIDNKL